MKGTIQPDWNNKVDLSTQGIAEVFNTLDTSGGFSLSDEIPVNISGTPYKITGQTLANIVGGGGAQQAGLTNYIKNCGTISSLPTTLTDSNITSDMIVLEATLGTPSVLTSDLTVTTANGSVTISGSISGSTTLTIVFGVGYTVAPTILTNLGSSTPDNILKADPRPGVTGILPVTNGGTNSSTAAGARTSLDVYSKSEVDSAIQQSTATGGSDYVKLPDGTMIEYGSASYAIATSIKTYSIQFSQQFIDSPVVTVSTGAGGARVPVYAESIGKTGFELVFTAHSTTSTSWARWMAIGHWK